MVRQQHSLYSLYNCDIKLNSVNLQYELDNTLKIISQNNKRLYCHGRKVVIYHRTYQTN